MKKTYSEIYMETIEELKNMFKLRLGRNSELKQEERDRRTRELWAKLRVPHEKLPARGAKPMVHFGGSKDGEVIIHNKYIHD